MEVVERNGLLDGWLAPLGAVPPDVVPADLPPIPPLSFSQHLHTALRQNLPLDVAPALQSAVGAAQLDALLAALPLADPPAAIEGVMEQLAIAAAAPVDEAAPEDFVSPEARSSIHESLLVDGPVEHSLPAIESPIPPSEAAATDPAPTGSEPLPVEEPAPEDVPLEASVPLHLLQAVLDGLVAARVPERSRRSVAGASSLPAAAQEHVPATPPAGLIAALAVAPQPAPSPRPHVSPPVPSKTPPVRADVDVPTAEPPSQHSSPTAAAPVDRSTPMIPVPARTITPPQAIPAPVAPRPPEVIEPPSARDPETSSQETAPPVVRPPVPAAVPSPPLRPAISPPRPTFSSAALPEMAAAVDVAHAAPPPAVPPAPVEAEGAASRQERDRTAGAEAEIVPPQTDAVDVADPPPPRPIVAPKSDAQPTKRSPPSESFSADHERDGERSTVPPRPPEPPPAPRFVEFPAADHAREPQGVPMRDPHVMVQRLTEFVWGAQHSGREIAVRLAPPELGPLLIEVRAEHGVITARLETHSDAAQQVLQRHVSQLHEALAQRGATIDRVEVIRAEPRGLPAESYADGRGTGHHAGSGADGRDPPRRRSRLLARSRDAVRVDAMPPRPELGLRQINVRV